MIFFLSVIVHKIDVVGVVSLEPKHDTPVTGDRYGPQALEFSFERMKRKPRKGHIPNFGRFVEARQDALDLFHVSRREAPVIVMLKEPFQPAVPKRRYHRLILV
jgi:hypothetical protein